MIVVPQVLVPGAAAPVESVLISNSTGTVSDAITSLTLCQLVLVLCEIHYLTCIYRVGQIKRGHCAFLLVTNECIYQNL